MEKELSRSTNLINQPLEIDIRKILEQLGIQIEKWPEEYKNAVQKP
jgi:hypothetical protein